MQSYLNTRMAQLARLNTGIIATFGLLSAWIGSHELWPASLAGRSGSATPSSAAWFALALGVVLAVYALFRTVLPNSAVQRRAPLSTNIASQIGWHLLAVTSIAGLAVTSVLSTNSRVPPSFLWPALISLGFTGVLSLGLLDLAQLLPTTKKKFLKLPALSQALNALLIPGGIFGIYASVRMFVATGVFETLDNPPLPYVVVGLITVITLGLHWANVSWLKGRLGNSFRGMVLTGSTLFLLIGCVIQQLWVLERMKGHQQGELSNFNWLLKPLGAIVHSEIVFLGFLVLSVLGGIVGFIFGKKK